MSLIVASRGVHQEEGDLGVLAWGDVLVSLLVDNGITHHVLTGILQSQTKYKL